MSSKIKAIAQNNRISKRVNGLIEAFGQAIGIYGEYHFTLRQKGSATKYSGVAKIGWNNTGTATIEISGELSEGNWIFAETELSGLHVDTSNNSIDVKAKSKGVGNAILKSRTNPDHQIVCEFVFDEASAKGSGEGRNNDGNVYEMEVVGPM